MHISHALGIVKRCSLLVVLGVLVLSVPGGCPSINQNAGRELPAANLPPVLYFLQPSGDVSLYQGESTKITWYGTDAEDSARVELYCDRDGLYGSGDETLVTVAYTTADRPDLSYVWTPGPILPGAYHIIAVADDAVNDPVTATLAGTITVKSSGPSLAIFEPALPMTIKPGRQTTIGWSYDSPLKDGEVTLFYDNDRDAGNGVAGTITTAQVAAGSGSRTYAWQVPTLPAGQYYVGATLDDQEHPPVVVYASAVIGIDAPALCVDSPASTTTVRCADFVPVKWRTDKTSLEARITVFIDRDGLAETGDETTLAGLSQPAGTSGGAQNVSLPVLAAGQYHVGVQMDDGQNAPVVAYAAGLVIVSGPGLTFSQPSGTVNARGGGLVPVQWQAQAGNASATLTIFYDDNKVYADGTLGTVVERSGVQDPAGDAASWTVPALPAGTYYVGGILSDGLNSPAVIYAASQVVVGAPVLTLTVPAQDVTVARNSTVPVSWKAQAGGASATVTVFYDDDRDFGNGTLGQALQWTGTPKASGDTGTWTVPALAAKAYHICATLSDGINPPVTEYAAGKIHVSSSTLTFSKPGGALLKACGDTVDIQWLADTDGIVATVTIFYDDDTDYANGTAGQVAQRTGVPAAAGDSEPWTLPILKAGPYHIGGEVDDGLNPPLVVYASGAVVVAPPQLELSEPSRPQRLPAGSKVQIAWSYATNATAGKVELFYDTDTRWNNGIGGTIATIDVPASATDMTYDWVTPHSVGGFIYIGATLTDGLNAPVTAYAIDGRIQVDSPSTLTRPLDEVEYMGFGRTFRGLSPGGRLGAVASQVPWMRWKEDPKDPRPAGEKRLVRQPGIDFNADQYDDFVLVAPTANPFYLERPNAGEAYLVHSDPAALFDLSLNLDPLVVSKTGSSNGHGDDLHGVIFVGPVTTGATESIGAVSICPDADSDGIPEVMFGFPWVDKIHQEEQDYDPWDQGLDALGALALSPCTYGDPYRKPSRTAGSGTSMDAITGGFVVAVSGSSGQIGAALTTPSTDDTVIGLDYVGQGGPDDVHPLVVPSAKGLRLYCPDPFRRGFPQADASVMYPEKTVSHDIRDQSRFGESMVQADVDGDGIAEWIFIQAASPADQADFSHGRLYVMWPQLSRLWDTDLAGLGQGSRMRSMMIKLITTKTDVTNGQKLDASGNPVTPAVPTIITTTTTTVIVNSCSGSTIETITDVHVDITEVEEQGGAPTPYPPQPPADTRTATTAPAPAGMNPLASDTCAYSWPYAVGVGDYSMQLDLNLDTLELKAKVLNDTRDRQFIYPMFFDCVQGYNVAGHGHGDEVLGRLQGLANAGDFNHDNREDITIGAPEANPGGLTKAGCAFLVFGRANFGDHSLSTIGLQNDDALAGIKIMGSAADQQLGAAQANAGDLNGDGISDWIIGILGYNGGAGAAAIIYGTTGRQGAYSLSDIGTNVLPGILLTGVAAGDAAGSCVAGIGDVDGDGYDDVAILAPAAGATLADGSKRDHCGVVYLVYGGPQFVGACGTLTLADVGTARLSGKIYAGLQGGTSQVQTVAPAGDVDNDGRADFLIGNPAADAQNALDVGEVYLIHGGDRLAP